MMKHDTILVKFLIASNSLMDGVYVNASYAMKSTNIETER
jgi:hypothetical protein